MEAVEYRRLVAWARHVPFLSVVPNTWCADARHQRCLQIRLTAFCTDATTSA
jgi:hypothetical protein